MSMPPQDLLLNLDPAAILDSLEIQVKGLDHEPVKCPICRSQCMSIYADPRIATKWFYCRSCHRHGDFIQLFMQAKAKEFGDDTQKALYYLYERKALKMDFDKITKKLVSDYEDEYIKPQDRAKKYWSTFTDSKESLRTEAVNRRQEEMLYVSNTDIRYERLARYVGFSQRNRVNYHFNNPVLTEGFKAALILNYQDVPGRTSALQFIGEKGDIVMRFFADHKEIVHKEGGLAMLDTLRSREEDVFAFSDYRMALQLQKQHFHAFSEPLKLIIYNEQTKRAWQSFSAKRTIFYAHELTIELFKQAKLASNGHITLSPSFREATPTNIHDYVLAHEARGTLEIMQKDASPWLQALGRWVMSSEVGDSRGAEILKAVGVNPEERRQMYGLLTTAEGGHMQRIFGGGQALISALMKGIKYYVDGLQWWIERKSGDECFMDASVELIHTIYDPNKNKNYLEGIVHFNGKIINFYGSAESILRDPITWLQKITTSGGILKLHPTATKDKLAFLIREFNKEAPHVEMAAKTGLQSDSTIIFPKFKLVEGHAVEEDAHLPESTPGMNMKSPRKRIVTPLEPSPMLSAYTAIGACYLNNMLCSLRDEQPRPICLITGSGSVGQMALKKLIPPADFPVYKLQNGRALTIGGIREKARDHNHMSVVETESAGLLSKYPTKTDDNILITMNALEAESFAISCSCMLVNGMARTTLVNELPLFDDFLWYLANLQLRKYKFPEAGETVFAILKDLCAFWSEHFNQDHSDLYKEAAALIHLPTYPGEQLVSMHCALYGHGWLRVEHQALENAGTYQRRPASKYVVIDDEKGLVYLARNDFVSLLNQIRLPIPDLQEATEDLARRKELKDGPSNLDGWVLSKGYWDEATKKWQKRLAK